MSAPTRCTALAAALLVSLVCEGAAQELPLLDAGLRRMIAQEISGDAAYAHVRFMSQFHRPRGGADGLWTVAEYYAAKAREYGLSDVRIIKQQSGNRPWNARFGDLWLVDPQPTRIASTLQSPLHLADFSRPADVTGALADIGRGDSAGYAGQDVRGKIVLTYGSLERAMREAVGNRGALGVIWYPDPYSGLSGTAGAGAGMPDQIRWTSLPSGTLGGKEPTFAFVLSLRQGIDLHNQIAQAKAPLTAHAVVRADWTSTQGDAPWQVMVEAFIRGTEPGLAQDIVLTGHLQEEDHSANDDASGCASVLEIGRALTKLIAEGTLPRPRRNIRFWWTTEISSEGRYFAEHPEVVDSIWVNVNQDMVGANQGQDLLRVQNVTRLPATRFHFLNDVTEAVVEHLVRTNTYQLAGAQAGIALYPDASLAHMGTMHRYNAAMIWFHNNTDHMAFTVTPIGVPGVTFTNMPDRFIHSSDDDLWNIDATQLGRNALAVATIAYIMASADGRALPALAAEANGRGAERLAHDLRLGLSWLATSADRTAAYFDAVDQVRFAAARERLALASLGQIAPDAGRRTAPFLAGVDRRETAALAELDAAYRHATGNRAPARPSDSVTTRLAAMRPAVVGGPAAFEEKRGAIGSVPGLHSLMAFEVLNAVDGRRSGLDIYRFVAAEAREGGVDYYGTVRAADVLQYLEQAGKTGLIRLR